MSPDTSHSYFHNRGESVGSYGRGGYRSHTSHSYSHNPGGHGIFLCLSVDSCRFHESVNGDKRGDISGYG